ncbi:MAG TPA: AAA family ATPase, partial [Bryobacteraceae bacterium]|nr:AAA family ATPase [Bryobacteraceae bacterium]
MQLAPKAYAVLSYLIENPGRIVSKEELLDAVWSDTFVQEAVLKSCVLEIRKALGENSKDPRHIKTVHRRGYTFVDLAAESPARLPTTGLLGRAADLQRLHSLLEKAGSGNRQIAFVTGEPGIGKSTLIEHFVKQAATHTLRGECIEHFGAHEAYYPLLDALGRAMKNASIPGLPDALRTYAPTWLREMPGSVSPEDREALNIEALGATRDRMLREITEAIEALATREVLLLVLEDLQWSDLSTLDVISRIAHRVEYTRLLVIASYRPVEVILNNHPVRSLKRDLLARDRCVEFELELLNKSDVGALLNARFPGHSFPGEFADLVHTRTEGNPLFVLNVLDYAVSRNFIARAGNHWRLNAPLQDFDLGMPESLAQALANQVERLTSQEQAVLENSSVAGVAFPVSLIVSGPEEQLSCETCCDALAARDLFIQAAGLAAFGSLPATPQYRFTHALYRDFFYKRLSPARRVRLHQTIAERLERIFDGAVRDVAPELALHFEQGRCVEKAIFYLRLVAERRARRHALQESLDALERALNLAATLPDPGRTRAELELNQQLGLVYRLMGQLPASLAAFEKMFDLAVRADLREFQLHAQCWLASVASWVDRDRCLRAVDTIVSLCSSGVDADLYANAMAQVAYWNMHFRGWDERDARASAAGLEVARSSGDKMLLALHATRHSYFQVLSSRYREACETAQEGVRIASEFDSLLDYSVGHFFEASALLFLGEWGQLERLLHSAMDMVRKNGHETWEVLFGLMEAYLWIEAFSFEPARSACEAYLKRSRALG